MNLFDRARRSLTRCPAQTPAEIPSDPRLIEGVAAPVIHAAALLDRHAPGWDRVIDLDQLVMYSTERCILGQLAQANHPPFRYRYTGMCGGLFSAAYDKLLKISGWNSFDGAFSGHDSSWRLLITRRREHEGPQDEPDPDAFDNIER